VDFACSLNKKNFMFITSQWTSLVFLMRDEGCFKIPLLQYYYQ
jgi:hypothetical protein